MLRPHLRRRFTEIRRTLFAFFLAIALVPVESGAQTLTKTVTLIWTAPGDDGGLGRATRYDFRYCARAISGADTLSWWNTASMVNLVGKVPSPSGTRDSLSIPGLVIGKKYYAVLRAADEAGNWSGFSNVAVIDLTSGITSVEVVTMEAPKLVVGAPYPSPTRGHAQIAFELGRSGPVTADVYDVRGRLVRSLQSGFLESGSHVLRWDGQTAGGAPAAAGVYWIRVSAEEVRKTVKLIVVR